MISKTLKTYLFLEPSLLNFGCLYVYSRVLVFFGPGVSSLTDMALEMFILSLFVMAGHSERQRGVQDDKDVH